MVRRAAKQPDAHTAEQTSEQTVAQTATQTRERILAAAVAEFGARGYSGARTAAIAARAGVNAQLISYHFGGKQGLLNELRRRWAAKQADLVPADASFPDSFAAYLDATLDQCDWARLVIWQALGDTDRPEPAVEPTPDPVARIRARQRRGEVAADLDPAFVALLTHALAFAPIAMPRLVASLFPDDPDLIRYRRRCVDQVTALVKPDRCVGGQR
jgi:TetR/AcrR family transcriptional regulator